jgi:hypothetical protein
MSNINEIPAGVETLLLQSLQTVENAYNASHKRSVENKLPDRVRKTPDPSKYITIVEPFLSREIASKLQLRKQMGSRLSELEMMIALPIVAGEFARSADFYTIQRIPAQPKRSPGIIGRLRGENTQPPQPARVIQEKVDDPILQEEYRDVYASTITSAVQTLILTNPTISKVLKRKGDVDLEISNDEKIRERIKESLELADEKYLPSRALLQDEGSDREYVKNTSLRWMVAFSSLASAVESLRLPMTFTAFSSLAKRHKSFIAELISDYEGLPDVLVEDLLSKFEPRINAHYDHIVEDLPMIATIDMHTVEVPKSPIKGEQLLRRVLTSPPTQQPVTEEVSLSLRTGKTQLYGSSAHHITGLISGDTEILGSQATSEAASEDAVKLVNPKRKDEVFAQCMALNLPDAETDIICDLYRSLKIQANIDNGHAEKAIDHLLSFNYAVRRYIQSGSNPTQAVKRARQEKEGPWKEEYPQRWEKLLDIAQRFGPYQNALNEALAISRELNTERKGSLMDKFRQLGVDDDSVSMLNQYAVLMNSPRYNPSEEEADSLVERVLLVCVSIGAESNDPVNFHHKLGSLMKKIEPMYGRAVYNENVTVAWGKTTKRYQGILEGHVLNEDDYIIMESIVEKLKEKHEQHSLLREVID